MGSSEMPTKEAKTPTTQEQSLGTATGIVDFRYINLEQPHPHMPPHGYMASSPQGSLPYMWGVQQLMPPYGTPPHPYVAMYPLSGIYAHPSMPLGSYPFSPYTMPSPNGGAEASGNSHTPGNTEVDGKSPDGKEKPPIKRSKGSLGRLNTITGPDAVKYILNHSSAQDIFCVPQRLHSDAYELGSTVCPIAVKYNKTFVDAF